MQIFSKYVFIAVLAVLPIIATASVNSPSFSCSSTFAVSFNNGYQASCDGDFTFDHGILVNDKSISITANGLLNVGEQAILTAPNIFMSASEIVVEGRLNAFGGAVEINASESFEVGKNAKLDSNSTSLSVVNHILGQYSFYRDKSANLDLAGSITIGSGANITNGSFNSEIGLLSDSVGEGLNFISVCNGCCFGCAAILLPSVSQVPEPSSLSLLAMGLFCVVLVVRRKSKRS